MTTDKLVHLLITIFLGVAIGMRLSKECLSQPNVINI